MGAVESGAEGLYGRSQLHLGVTGCHPLCTLHSTHLHFALLCTVFHCLRNLRPSAASSLLHVDKVVFDDAAKKWYGLRNTFPRTPHQKFTFTLFTLPYFALFILHCSNSHFAQLGIVLKCFTLHKPQSYRAPALHCPQPPNQCLYLTMPLTLCSPHFATTLSKHLVLILLVHLTVVAAHAFYCSVQWWRAVSGWYRGTGGQ